MTSKKMKKGVLFTVLFLILIFPFALAQETEEVDSQINQVDDAYACLNNQIDSITCAKLSPTQRIFSLMAIGKCKTEMMNDAIEGICWPRSDCSLKITAQAILALEKISDPTTNAENWLLDQNDTPEDVDWFLQIESSQAAECEISYSTGGKYDIRIREDKKLSGTAGNCLSLSSGGWWYRISPSCYNVEYEITCDEAFLTNLLFKEKTSSTIHISEETSSTSAEGITTEKVNSFCLEDDGRCDYEGTLWATVALDSVGYDVTQFMPYLITGANKNQEIIPEAFLYLLTGYDEFRNTVLEKQKNNQFWDESGNKFFDTALALFPFQYSSAQEKSNTMEWLFEVQESNGCWDGGNVLSNSFLLSSIWPQQVVAPDDFVGCEESGFYCMSQVNCEGQTLPSYSCSSGTFVCCDTPRTFDICSEQGGNICSSSQNCVGGTVVEASDIRAGESCCTGRCEEKSVRNDCQLAGGVCRSFACGDSEEESTNSCDFGSDICCLPKEESIGLGLFAWILIILIIIVILAIIFRERLRPYWNKIKSKFDKGDSTPQRKIQTPRFPPASSQIPFKAKPRRMPLPQQRRQPIRKPQKVQRSGELDKVLKQLKEISQ